MIEKTFNFLNYILIKESYFIKSKKYHHFLQPKFYININIILYTVAYSNFNIFLIKYIILFEGFTYPRLLIK